MFGKNKTKKYTLECELEGNVLETIALLKYAEKNETNILPGLKLKRLICVTDDEIRELEEKLIESDKKEFAEHISQEIKDRLFKEALYRNAKGGADFDPLLRETANAHENELIKEFDKEQEKKQETTVEKKEYTNTPQSPYNGYVDMEDKKAVEKLFAGFRI